MGYTPQPLTATDAGGMHPTGMHSCVRKYFLCYFFNEEKLLKINYNFVMTSKILGLFEFSSMCGSRDRTVCDVL